MHKNCVALNKEKDVGLIQASSADEDDKDDEYDSRISPNFTAQNLRRIKQRKGLCFIQALSNDVDDQDDDLIAPYTFHDSVPKCNHHSRTPC